MFIYLPIKALSVNQAFQGRRFKTKECKAYCKTLLDIIPKTAMIKGEVFIEYRFYLRNWKKTDIDNLVKITQDCLVEKGVIEDDRFIMKMLVEKIPSKTDYIEITVDKK